MKKYSKETVVGIFVIIGLLCITYMAVNLGNVGFIGENTYSLYGKFNTVSGLRVGNPVNSCPRLSRLEISSWRKGWSKDSKSSGLPWKTIFLSYRARTRVETRSTSGISWLCKRAVSPELF